MPHKLNHGFATKKRTGASIRRKLSVGYKARTKTPRFSRVGFKAQKRLFV